MAIEDRFDVGFVAKLASEEKQIQQTYRPVIGVHKWFARRSGSLFRALLLAEFSEGESLSIDYFRSHQFGDVTIADPFMGGGSTVFEANRLGCNVVGCDINPMAYWVVREELKPVDRKAFRDAAEAVVRDVERVVGEFYRTKCVHCQQTVPVKYFLWVKQQRCGGCGSDLDLFPGFLIAGNERHTHYVLHCPGCRELVQVKRLPAKGSHLKCPECSHEFDWAHGSAARNRYHCRCGHEGRYPAELREEGAPRHRLIGLEYHCEDCKPGRKGRFFKSPDEADLVRFARAARQLQKRKELILPEDEIPDGDETRRLHRWGYGHRVPQVERRNETTTPRSGYSPRLA